MSLFYALFFLSAFLIPQTLTQNDTVSCPLNFTILSNFISDSKPTKTGSHQECQYIKNGLRLVQSDYLKRTNSFVPPLNSAESCWRVYQDLVGRFVPNFDIRSSCGYNTSWISVGCVNITTRSQFEAAVPASSLDDVASNCNQSLENNSPCASCTTSLSKQQANYLTGKSIGNLTDCQSYPSIYAGAFSNRFGPADRGTAKCLFLLHFEPKKSSKKNKILIPVVVSVILVVGILLIFCGYCYFRRIKRKRSKTIETGNRGIDTAGLRSGLESFSESTNLVKFNFDDIREATRNFSRDNLIGRGGYGNVYKGVLIDGSHVAFKRFKNLSAAGDASFVHEVEVIASVRHVNLVALRGYCTATTSFEGHQRIIVCDLMKNGSLHDHLFGGGREKLSWPIRQKIALGTARGLAYLHYGIQPAIIHRDIKASNILLDERFEPKVADFGLAKFTPEGATHLSTRVAGTMGYVAPEYALYGQLTERSDVYSFGVVLLELMSGKKALVMTDDCQPALVTDWAWSLVRKCRTLDVIEEDMPELGPHDVVEKYVLVALLCAHPQLYARPTMDQVVKMLETDQAVPTIPERPIPLVAEMDDIEKSVSSSGSGQLSSSAGYQFYAFENSRHSNGRERHSSDSRPVESL